MSAWIRNKRQSQIGSTLVEAIIAAAVLAIAVGGVCLTCWKTINLLRVNKAETAATSCLDERMEQIRNANWAQITSGSFIRSAMTTQPSAAPSIPGYGEEVTVNSYPAATTAIDVTASAAGSAVINSNNSLLSTGGSGSMVKVDISVTWPNYYGATHQRTVTTVISNGGITH
ncbi:MAG: hypothetical protein WCD79_04695 [Chthoniobacteraceae bacterium]